MLDGIARSISGPSDLAGIVDPIANAERAAQCAQVGEGVGLSGGGKSGETGAGEKCRQKAGFVCEVHGKVPFRKVVRENDGNDSKQQGEPGQHGEVMQKDAAENIFPVFCLDVKGLEKILSRTEGKSQNLHAGRGPNQNFQV